VFPDYINTKIVFKVSRYKGIAGIKANSANNPKKVS